MTNTKEDKKILFITYDLTGYYDGIHEELSRRYTTVEYHNIAAINFKYQNVWQRLAAFGYKLFTGKKLKNYYKYRAFLNKIKPHDIDITLIVRPDLFFDSQLEILRKASKYMVAYYHDSISNIKRKKDVIGYFDKVFSYEKKDATDYNLDFLSNFIYFESEEPSSTVQDTFSVMSNDYRLPVLKRLALFFDKKKISYKFCAMGKKDICEEGITYITKRMANKETIANLKQSKIIVDIHKFGVQDGLTFRVFESLALKKKLITTNKDIKTYSFYNPNNIYVIEDVDNIDIPESFFNTPYQPPSEAVIYPYTIRAWVDIILKQPAI